MSVGTARPLPNHRTDGDVLRYHVNLTSQSVTSNARLMRELKPWFKATCLAIISASIIQAACLSYGLAEYVRLKLTMQKAAAELDRTMQDINSEFQKIGIRD